MLVKDLNEILKRCGFELVDEKLVNDNGPSHEFLQMAINRIKPKEWTNNIDDIIVAIRYLSIAIFLVENEKCDT